jgi:hypothetical protein
MHPSTLAVLVIPVLTLFAVAAGADEGPQQKPGLWETHLQNTSDKQGAGKPGIAQNCLDAAAMAHGKQVAEEYTKKNCSKHETRHVGGKWVSDLVCKVGTSTMTTHSVTDSSDNAYHTVMTTTYDPPMAGRSQTSMTVDGKWLGACKAD